MTLVTDQGCAGTLHGDVLVPGPAAAWSAAAPVSAPQASALSYSALRHLDVHERVQAISGDADGSAFGVSALVLCTSMQLHLVELCGNARHEELGHHRDPSHYDTEQYHDRRYCEYEPEYDYVTRQPTPMEGCPTNVAETLVTVSAPSAGDYTTAYADACTDTEVFGHMARLAARPDEHGHADVHLGVCVHCEGSPPHVDERHGDGYDDPYPYSVYHDASASDNDDDSYSHLA